VKRIYLLWVGSRDVHYPTDVPDMVHVERLSQEKPRSKDLAPKFDHLGRPIE